MGGDGGALVRLLGQHKPLWSKLGKTLQGWNAAWRRLQWRSLVTCTLKAGGVFGESSWNRTYTKCTATDNGQQPANHSNEMLELAESDGLVLASRSMCSGEVYAPRQKHVSDPSIPQAAPLQASGEVKNAVKKNARDKKLHETNATSSTASITSL
ncbi:hypothetical protein M431DRAFT_527765 [Trichoderma harzianum CBS 226.95]|uniref:Uncharacterized protein n=1 Tax=Trichoderma harzianum CBS 226.95 TaxID=983964 RepID=A0A2T4AQ69_TRIHA|nr:hypothetical protein M431DRAFT_527765 [Trichoderma harzianum CBS 226.95]PTB59214.1 hypothetical protein M431DRAFT_527765 [Trichoderma harzianum CBS 226.95]